MSPVKWNIPGRLGNRAAVRGPPLGTFYWRLLRPNPKENMVYGTLCMIITSPCVDSRVDSNTCILWASATLYQSRPSLTLCQSQFYPPVRDLGFGLWTDIERCEPSLSSPQMWLKYCWQNVQRRHRDFNSLHFSWFRSPRVSSKEKWREV